MWTHAYVDRIAFDALQEVERPDPEAGPGQVVVRLEAVALNYRDLAIARGHYHVGVSAPLVPLSDGAGRVVATGPGVTRFRLGELVCPTYLPDWIDGPIAARGGGGCPGASRWPGGGGRRRTSPRRRLRRFPSRR